MRLVACVRVSTPAGLVEPGGEFEADEENAATLIAEGSATADTEPAVKPRRRKGAEAPADE